MPYKIYLTPSARERLEVSVITASSYVEEENFVYKVFLFTEGLANETPNKHVFLHKLNDIQQIEEIEHRPVEDEEVESSGDCFIATACEADPATLKTLRKFRDEVLRASEVGERLIAAYYKLGPQAARFIRHKPFLKKVILIGLISPLTLVVKLWNAMVRKRSM